MEERKILPTNVKPIKYTLNLIPDFETFKFNGSLRFDFKILHQTNKIILNAKELDIHSFTIYTDNLFRDATILYNIESDQVTFTFDKEFGIGYYHALINYTGTHNDKMAGFYRSMYKDKEGNQKYLVTTQFEAIDARRAFPCLDEPVHKAKFQVTLNVPVDLVALSNTEVIKEEIFDNLKRVTFAETPIMSTYLLAFYVGEADYIESYAHLKSKDVKCRVYTPVGKSAEGHFALDLCTKVLEFYSEFFGIDYPLNKMDMIAIPDFAAGAMENWGLITYRTKYILYNPKETSKSMRTTIAYIICHELAHQWFGNLVTMSWWSELWLNEGFATWVGWMATNYCFPDLKVWETFYEQEFQQGMALDSLTSSHPIEMIINDASNVDQIFDAISYSKGACVIGMLVGYLGLETFKNGIHEYLIKYKYSNATTNDLWYVLEKYSGKPVNKLMSSWTQQIGYPLLHVSFGPNKINIKQEKFNNPTNEKLSWCIPLNIYCDGEFNPVLMEDNEFKLSNKIKPLTFKLNYGMTGFYRVAYDKPSLDLISENIRKKEFTTIDRASIINDLSYFAKFGYGSIVQAINYCTNYKAETEYTVLDSVMNILNYTKSTWYNNFVIVGHINKMQLDLLQTLIKETSFYVPDQENEDHFTSLRRVLVLETACECGDEKVIEECKNRFDRYIDGDKQAIHPDLRSLVFKTVMYNQPLVFEKLVDLYKNTDIPDEKNALLGAFGNCSDITKVLDFAFEEVRPQDLCIVIRTIANGINSRQALFEYLVNHWPIFCSKLKGGSFLFGKVIGYMIDSFSTNEKLEEIEVFLNENKKDIKGLEKTIEQSKERVRIKIALRERDHKELSAYFSNQSYEK